MISVKVSENGQITIPSSIRKEAHLLPGTRVELELRDNEIVLRPIKPLHELYGVFKQYAIGIGNDYDHIRELAIERVAEEIAHEDQQ